MLRNDNSLDVGEDDIHALVDGRLDPARHRDVMGHLAGHHEAADRVSVFLRQRVQLAALRERLDDVEPTRDIDELTQALGARVYRHRRLRRALGASAIGLATAAGIAVMLVIQGGQPREMAALTSASREAGPRNPMAEADRVGLAAGDAPLLRMQAGLSGQILDRPDLERVGLRFVGSSPLSSSEAPAARLVYEDEQRRPFHLFMGPPSSGVGLAASFVPQGHIALSWSSGPLVFALIAPKDSPQLDAIIGATSALVDPTSVAAEATLGETAAMGTTADPVTAEPPASPAAGDEPADGVSKRL